MNLPTLLAFDLDGTLVHTDPLHFAAWRAMLSAHRVEVDDVTYARDVSGRHNPDIVADLLPHLGPREGRAFADAKEARFRELAGASLRPLPGVRETLATAKAAGVPVAVVTNAPRENAWFMLRALGLHASFDAVGLGEEAAAPKPDPAPYAEMAERFGVDPATALAFEDSPSGIASARGAGMHVVGLATTQRPHDLLAAGASWVIEDYRDPLLWSGPLAGFAKPSFD